MDGQNGHTNSDLGDEIRNVVDQALNRGDLSNLNDQVRDSINSAMKEVGIAMNEIRAEFQKNGRTNNNVRYSQPRSTVRYTGGNTSNVNKVIGTNKAAIKRNAKAQVKADIRSGLINRPGDGNALFIVGIVFLSIFGIGVLDGLGSSFDYDMLMFAVPGAITFGLGLGKKMRFKRMMTYYNLSKEKGYVSIAELARVVARPKSFVVKDIYKMIGDGLFPQAHIDETETYFILDTKTNDLYENMMKSHKEAEETAKAEAKAEEEQQADKVSETVAMGRRYINDINRANDQIPGEEITRKLSELTLIMDRIFSFVEEHPEQEGSIRKFIDYYLPTTLKLVKAYKDFDADPVQGENIINSKREIEETIDTIIGAFKKLYDDLYADTAMDISTDINVLNTLFAQDGLTKEQLKNN